MGTLLGISPGIIAISIFEHQLELAVRNPGAGVIALLLVIVAAIVVSAAMVRRWIFKKGA